MDPSRLPRFPLATLPTPLDELPRLSKELGIRILMKRDDLTGFAMGGNKARKLEFLLADALAQHADVLVTGGGVQSNHVRMTAAAARKAGMEAVAVLFDSPGAESNGNLLLDKILGTELIYAGTDDKNETELVVERVCADLSARGRNPYLISVGGSTKLGCVAYILAVRELLDQLKARHTNLDSMVITTGSCGTHAGILAGLKYYGGNIPLYGITVSRPVSEGFQRINRLMVETAKYLETDLRWSNDDIFITGDYIGPGYAKITRAARDAIRLVAKLEGIFLDPVYTGKTMAGLIDLAWRKWFAPGSTVLFWHTGGIPGLFGFPQDLL